MAPANGSAPCGAKSSCDECPAAYECQILRTLLTIVERHKGLLEDETLRSQYERLRVRLEIDSWSFPESTSRCGLAAQPLRVRWLTQELVRFCGISRKSRRHSVCS